MKFLLPLVGLFAIVHLSGCAFGDRKVSLQYETRVTAKASKPQVISVQKFTEHRDRKEVGRVRNGYGMVTAKVYAEGQDVGAWVSDALAAELRSAGCNVVRNGASPANITGDVTDAFGDVFFSISGNVDATITVKRGGKVVLEKKFEGKASKTAWTASGHEYEEALKRSLQNMMEQAVPEILKALEN